MIGAPDIPGHTVTGVLGSGGFATVYRTWQVAVGRETAVKVDSRVLHTERDQRRFYREVTAAGRLSGHPHVIDVYDAGTLRDGRPYLVMELCPDGSLNDELRRNGPMGPDLVGRIGNSLADALAAAHSAGILHRDIKPANILINRYGVVGLSDFGLASIIAASGEQSVSREALTPAYAPPESFQAAEPTVAADLYSLAATLYALMAGRPPRFPADSSSPGVATILGWHGQPVDDIPGIPLPMMAILRQCLSPNPARRLPSAAVLRDELAVLIGRPGRDQAPAPAAQPPSPMPATHTVPSARPVETSTDSRSHVADEPSASTEPFVGTSWSRSAAPSQARSSQSPAPGMSPARAGHRHPGRRRAGDRRVVLAAAVGGASVAVVIAAVLIGVLLLAPGGPARVGAANTGSTKTGPAGSIGSFGIATTGHCPAAHVPGAGARCPASLECWAGLVENEGVITESALPCRGTHTWQTFAIGIMPSEGSSFNVNIVQANPTVRAVCSYRVMLRSRIGQARLIPRSRWIIQVVPPDEAAYDSGVRTYRCLATVGLDGSRTSQFGR